MNQIYCGDNVEVLQRILPNYQGSVQCIYCDPPYNTKNKYTFYKDTMEHETYLEQMKQRILLLKEFLCDTGVLWLQADANEVHYLKVLCDQIFERKNFVNEVIWERSYASRSNNKYLSRNHDTLLIYSKNKDQVQFHLLPRTEEANARYKNYDHDPRGLWKSDNLSCMSEDSKYIYPIITPSGKVCYPPKGRSWRVSNDKFKELVKENRIWFGKKGSNVPSLKRFLSEVQEGMTATTVWKWNEVGHTDLAKKEIKRLFPEIEPFDTPKPEKLLERILLLSTQPGDLVLDPYVGSGTTCAVAHKMKRNYIGIEQQKSVLETYAIPRLQKVVEEFGGTFQYKET